MAKINLGVNEEDLNACFKKHGVLGIQTLLKDKLEQWKDVEINVGITGGCGAGKSSFINAIRGLEDDDELAAETGVEETTRDVAVYSHPINNKIKFWDLPGIGSTNYPDLKTYVEKVGLEKYDTFLIFTANRFTQNDLDLAERVKSMNKSFFFIRTKIDNDCRSERRRKKKAFNEEAMLQTIRNKYLEKLKDMTNDVFLISNHYKTKWDFPRLAQAILNVLPLYQRESLALCLTSHSKDMLKRKAEILRGRIWMVASASAAGAVVPVPGLSVVVDLALIKSEVNLYRTQLGLQPDEMPENLKGFFNFTTVTQLATLIGMYASSSTVEEFARFIPIVGLAVAGGISFSSTYYFLCQCLNKCEATALSLLDISEEQDMHDFDQDQ